MDPRPGLLIGAKNESELGLRLTITVMSVLTSLQMDRLEDVLLPMSP